MKKVVILHNAVDSANTKDEIDVLSQVDIVKKTLVELNYEVSQLGVDNNLQQLKETLLKIKPEFVFNLVETFNGKGEYHFILPAFLSSMNIPYSGSQQEAMIITSNKIIAKKIMGLNGIPTAACFSMDKVSQTNPSKKYIIKPIWEDASVGISDEMVFDGNSHSMKLFCQTAEIEKYFIEEFIFGREFNISVLGGKQGAVVLPPAETVFVDYPEGKPTIVNYDAKWNESTFEYKHTQRSFEFSESDKYLLEQLKGICLKCWNTFHLKGYVRVDFRVDETGKPFVLEINANPCISPDAGFYAASQQAGLEFKEVMKRIIEDIKKPQASSAEVLY